MIIVKTKRAFILTVIFLTTFFNAFSQDWRSELYPYNWKPGFAKDGKFIQDFSYAGYHKGEKQIPFITDRIVDVTQAPYNADKTGTTNATAAIQAAIDYVSGIGGGVVYLPEGTYKVQPNGPNTSALRVQSDGVVIRGAGIGQTMVLNTQTNMRTKSIISFEPSTDADWYAPAGTPAPLVQNAVEHDDTVFVANASSFAIGDRVTLTSDLTDEWIADHNMTGLWNDTMPGVAFARTVKSVNTADNSITVDIPVRYYLKTRDNARIYKVNKPITECGLESLSIGNLQNNKTGWGDEDYAVAGTGAFEVHNSHAIKMTNAENCWMKNVATFKPAANTLDIHVLSHSFRMVQCRLITVDACDFMKPQYEGEGGNGYMYILESNDCLIKNSKATSGRHNYSFRLANSNGNVIYNCLSKDPRLASDFHMWFSMTNLFDNQTCDKDYIEAIYRPFGGTPTHGQTTTQSVIWNTNGLNYQTGETAIVQSAQWGQGYVIGTRGAAPNVLRPSGNNSEPIDHLEGQGKGAQLHPASLYIDQLNRRLNGIGAIDSFGMNANIIPQVSLTAPLDDTTVDVSTALTISATALDADGSVTKVEFYRGTTLLGTDTTAPYSINWTPANATTFIITARAYDNNGVTNNSAAASVIVKAAITTTINATADSFVAGGTNADINYGAGTTQGNLIIKNSPLELSNTNKAIVKFNVSKQTRIKKAVVRLYVRFGGPNSITAYQTSDDWTELGVTWNNMPALGTQMTTTNINAIGYWEWNVTSFVQSQAAGDGIVSLIFQDDAADNIQLGISSKEFGTNQPQLVLTKSTNISPIVSLSAPSSGVAVDVSTPLTISATASDTDGSIARVDFYAGTKLLGSDTTAPYSISWTPTLSDTYVIQAKTFDNEGASASSILSYVEVKSPVTTTLNPIVDSYIQAGTNANLNFGTNGSLIIMNNSTSVNSIRKSILKFDVTGKTGIQKAVVRLYARFGTPNSISAYQTTDGWTELGVTWNNMPALGAKLLTTSITSASAYSEWDVTSYVQSQAAGDGIVSLVFQDDAAANIQLGINSKEYGSNLPELVIISGTGLSAVNRDYDKNELVIYPIPVKDKINVILPQNNKSKMIKLYNSFGQIVLQKTILSSDETISVDISNLSAGLYIIQLIGEQNLVRKVIKQ